MMMTRLYYMLLGVLLGSATVLAMSMLNLILISYIGYSYMSLTSSVIGRLLFLVLSIVSLRIGLLEPFLLIPLGRNFRTVHRIKITHN
jgi:hypothetical protein